MFASLKQARPATVHVGPEPTKIDGLFRGGVGIGASADPAAGKFVLPAGPYLVGFSGIAAWRWSRELEARIVVGNDPRFATPRVVLPRDRTAAEAAKVLRLHEAELAGRVPGARPDPLQAMRQSFSASGIVVLYDQAAVEVWAAAPGDGETITFEGVELFAIQLFQESRS